MQNFIALTVKKTLVENVHTKKEANAFRLIETINMKEYWHKFKKYVVMGDFWKSMTNHTLETAKILLIVIIAYPVIVLLLGGFVICLGWFLFIFPAKLFGMMSVGAFYVTCLLLIGIAMFFVNAIKDYEGDKKAERMANLIGKIRNEENHENFQ